MVRNKKKIVYILVALLIIVMAMAGCSGNKDAKTDSGSTGASDDKSQEASDKITVTVSILCDSLKDVDAKVMDEFSDNGVILKDTEVELEKGASAIDALRATKIDFVEEAKMIKEINGLGNSQLGGMSGWLFTLNGEFQLVAADELAVNDGDKLDFLFSVDGGADVGFSFE